MNPRRLRELDPTERRRAVAGSLLRCAVSVATILTLYYALPLTGRVLDGSGVALLGLGAVLYGGALIWQFRRIVRAELPQLRAVEALAIAIPLFIVIYSVTYVAMSHYHAATFGQPLTHTEGLYFTVVTLGTVGYGDIAPQTDAARLVVASQVLLDIALLAVLARVVFDVSRRRLERGETAQPDPERP